ncbi:MAG: chalcone isomerase family protein [Burkholderia sp.]|jgi:hypothetical protein|uniref:chalcone isomerase family protein n=4 Tax=Pseudomonadota TaxID=1224 RepID=UPI001CA444B3|nr:MULTISPECIES: chalcone isomerase family protein [Burkholderia]MBY8603709.1 chalcone isomerase family protein [Burkholderia arboris]MCA3777444.1 chalcone isomerase family protein [Burkholderia sp.]MCA3790071.1 chalcone isomerase family protein [Burkholderia sp.]MCA3792387.1 chalcone isomerase family protein [Burkholderia sp.]MCA3811753.1 chalcone isomerase family protein [Burkholderia sp.]
MWRPQVGSRWAPFILALLAVTNAGAGCVDDIAPAHTVGAGTFCILGFCLYDARLIASSVPVSFDGRFALELTYRRAIHGERLVKAGMDEIERLAEPPLPAVTRTTWRTDMERAFGDVVSGDVLCGVYLPAYGARFYANGRLAADIADPVFARAFFGIWLDPRTRAPSLRRQLLGVTGRN